MRDRVPTPGKENRVKITQDDGTVVAGVLEYDDQATQEGSPYTRGNVLPDDVCNAYNLDKVTSEPKDAFLAVPGIMGKALLTITVTKINGQPYPGVVVNGLSNVDAPRRTTNNEGKVVVYVDAGTYNLTFAPNPVCVDTYIPSKQATVSAGGTGNVTTQEASNGLTSLDITLSRSIAFSAQVQNLDAFLVGGGGSGSNAAANTRSIPGCGGGGGYTATYINIEFLRYYTYTAIIGAGGNTTAHNGSDGGGTSIFGHTANGGKGGTSTKGGNGGSGGGGLTYNPDGGRYYGGHGGEDGSNGEGNNSATSLIGQGAKPGTGQISTTRAFGETSGSLYAGGGAGGGLGNSYGGAGGGGDAGNNGSPNTGGGGGGGTTNAGNGGSGIIKLRWVNAS